ncbi:hypothetical protein E2562_006881, partial [Oryza meyeriana var. granulata]
MRLHFIIGGHSTWETKQKHLANELFGISDIWQTGKANTFMYTVSESISFTGEPNTTRICKESVVLMAICNYSQMFTQLRVASTLKEEDAESRPE